MCIVHCSVLPLDIIFKYVLVSYSCPEGGHPHHLREAGPHGLRSDWVRDVDLLVNTDEII